MNKRLALKLFYWYLYFTESKQALKESNMRFEVSYQCEMSPADFDANNKEVAYCFNNKAIKQAAILAEARKYGHGILHVINGNNVLEMICF